MRATLRRAPPIVREVLQTPGTPLDDATRRSMESRFDHDFSGVRVHSGSRAAESARAVQARAYTVGSSIVLGDRAFTPSLLAHELTHVVQQSGPHASGPLLVGDPHDQAEREADGASSVTVGDGPILRRELFGDEDRTHRGMIDSFRGQQGLADPDNPTDAQIKYQLMAPRQDASQIQIAAVPDVLLADFTSPRDVGVTVNATTVVSIEWQLIAPSGRVLASDATTAGAADALTRPFRIQPAHISAGGAGHYHLTCSGIGSNRLSRVYAARDFNILQDTMITGVPRTGRHGTLMFTEYDKLDANPPALNDFDVNVRLEFTPNAANPCRDVAFVQAVQFMHANGESYLRYASAQHAARGTAIGWTLDQAPGNLSPFYMSDTSQATGVTADRQQSRGGTPPFGTPESGPSAGRGGTSPQPALMRDRTGAPASRPVVGRFESCAICRSGPHAGEVYGCATWGYSATNGRVTLMPRGFTDGPSEEFGDAAREWNRWRDQQSGPSQPYRMHQLETPRQLPARPAGAP